MKDAKEKSTRASRLFLPSYQFTRPDGGFYTAENNMPENKEVKKHSDKASRKIQEFYHSLNDDLTASKDQDKDARGQTISRVVSEADKILPHLDRPVEVRDDAHLMYESSRMSENIIRQANIRADTEFDIKSVLPKLKENLFPSGAKPYEAFKTLGEHFYKVSKRAPSASFMMGPIYITKKPVTRKPRGEVLRIDHNTQKSAQQLESSDIQQGANQSTETIKDIYLRLDNQVKQDGPISLYQLVLNPESFAQSVENLFFVSFLVRDGKVSIAPDEDGVPIVSTEDLTKVSGTANGDSSSSSKKADRRQVVVNLDEESYEELIKLFEIEESFIPTRHYNEDGSFR